jgi:alkanesulfonate monooxygenase SsuD/methylene tetrahydromethanopterin reductase-like flavin-dependent oxidoreductase (luciferase family)
VTLSQSVATAPNYSRNSPKPLQQPSPPVWLAATSPDSIQKAAKDGYTILMDPHASCAEIARKRTYYREVLEEHGHSMEGREIPTARLIALAETEAEAEQVARSGASWMVGSYARPLNTGKQAGVDTSAGKDPVDRYLDDVVIWGTPERVVDRLLQLKEEVPLDYLMAAPLSHQSFLLFTEKVLPKLV